MKILMISTDREILSIGTFARARMEKYAAELGELHIIVLSREKKVEAPQSGALWVYTTRSLTPLLYGVDAFFKAFRVGRPHLVTVQDPFETGLIGLIISWLFLCPLHVQVHTDFLAPAFQRHSTLNRIRIFLAGIVLPRARRVRVVAKRIAEGIKARFNLTVPVSVLPIFVDTAKFEALQHVGHEKFSPALLVVSRLESEKRLDYALYALAATRKSEKNAGLIIVGDGREKQRLKDMATELGIAEWVEFVGKVDPLPYYARADMALVCSEYEGYGLVIIEALASGVPVIATDVGIAEEAGALIAPDDREGYAKTVATILSERPLPRAGLNGHPYESETEYIDLWAEDMMVTVLDRP